MIDRQTLSFEHEGLVEAAARLREAVAQARPDLDRVVRSRWVLGYRLGIHLAREDVYVYPALKAHADPVIASVARVFENEMGGLDRQFRDYVAAWPSALIAARWAEFAMVTRVLLAALTRRIEHEENDLYPLLDAPAGVAERRESTG